MSDKVYQVIHTFSVSVTDKESMELIAAIKRRCKKRGVSFTRVVLQALRDAPKDE